jgi:hypothetical protein
VSAVNTSKTQSTNDIYSSLVGDNISWEVDICLNDIQKLFIDIIEMNSPNRFSDLLGLLTKANKLIEKIMKNLKVDPNNNHFNINNSQLRNSLRSVRSPNNETHNTNSFSNERMSINSKNANVILNSNLNTNSTQNNIDELVDIFNKLFIPPNIYILYSEEFRSYFNIKFLFDRNGVAINTNTNEKGVDLDSSEHLISNSNKSILESLLN